MRMQSARALQGRAEPALLCPERGHGSLQLSWAGAAPRTEGTCSMQKVLLLQEGDSGNLLVTPSWNALALEVLQWHWELSTLMAVLLLAEPDTRDGKPKCLLETHFQARMISTWTQLLHKVRGGRVQKERREENGKIHAIFSPGEIKVLSWCFYKPEWLGKKCEEDSIDWQIGENGKMLNTGDLLQRKTLCVFVMAVFHLRNLQLIWELVTFSMFLTNEQTKSLPGFVEWRETPLTLTDLGETEREENFEESSSSEINLSNLKYSAQERQGVTQPAQPRLVGWGIRSHSLVEKTSGCLQPSFSPSFTAKRQNKLIWLMTLTFALLSASALSDRMTLLKLW